MLPITTTPSQPKNRIPLYIGILLSLAILISHTAVALAPAETLMRWYSSDDAFYYFQVARNISAGHGITFDRIASTNGFHPLWMAICVPIFFLTRIGLLVPLRALVLMLGVIQSASGLILYRLAAKVLSRPAAALVAILWIFSPTVHSITAQNGMESGISAFFLILTIYLLTRLSSTARGWSIVLVSLTATLTFLSRLDNIFLVVFLGLWLIYRSHPARHYLFFDLATTAFTALASFILRIGIGPVFYQYSTSALVMAAAGMIIKTLSYDLSGIYHSPSRLWRVPIAVSLGSLNMTIVMLALQKMHWVNGFPRTALLYDWGLSILLILANRALLHWLRPANGPMSEPVRPAGILIRHGWRNLRSGMIYFGILGITLVTYMSWNINKFGTPLPVSGQIKAWWGTLPDNIYGDPIREPIAFFGLDSKAKDGPWKAALSQMMFTAQSKPQSLILFLWVLYVGAGLILLKAHQSAAAHAVDRLVLLPLGVGCLIQSWVYHAQAYIHIREWYWVADLLLTCLLVGVIVDGLVGWIPAGNRRQLAVIGVTVLLGLYVLDRYTMMFVRLFHCPSCTTYLETVHLLETSTPPDTIIGMTGGGSTAYFIQNRAIINLDGLINSYTYFKALKKFQIADYLDRVGMDYVYGNTEMLTDTDPYRREFEGWLRPILEYSSGTLYRFVRK